VIQLFCWLSKAKSEPAQVYVARLLLCSGLKLPGGFRYAVWLVKCRRRIPTSSSRLQEVWAFSSHVFVQGPSCFIHPSFWPMVFQHNLVAEKGFRLAGAGMMV